MANLALAETTPAQQRERPSAVQLVYSALRARIVDMSARPGSQLSKNEIASEFGVSPTPVREALKLLEEEGLVEIYPQSRTVVSHIDIQSAREAHFLRRSVEVEIARILAGHASDIDVIDLRAMVQRQRAYLKDKNMSAFTEADNAFHRRMYEMAEVPGLYDIIRTRRAHLDRLRQLHLPHKGKASAIVKEHTKIVASIENHDPDAAEAATRTHLMGTVSSTEQIRALFPEYFSS